MDEFLKGLDQKLAKLPFNGDKTTISLALKAILPILAAKFPPLLLILPFTDDLLDLAVALGLGHKAVKAFREKVKELKKKK